MKNNFTSQAFLIFVLLISLQSFASIKYQVTFQDDDQKLTAQKALILESLDVAVQDWARFVSGKGILRIHIKVTETAVRMQCSGTGIFLKTISGQNIYDISGTYKMRTGLAVDAHKPDILILINPNFIEKTVFMDAQPRTQNIVIPAGKVNLVSLFKHELGHGFGIQGLLDIKTGRPISAGTISVFDSFIKSSGAQFKFDGAHARKAFAGQPIPLTFCEVAQRENFSKNGKNFTAYWDPSENFYHLGDCNGMHDVAESIRNSVSAGTWSYEVSDAAAGLRFSVTPLEAAILLDLGIKPYSAYADFKEKIEELIKKINTQK